MGAAARLRWELSRFAKVHYEHMEELRLDQAKREGQVQRGSIETGMYLLELIGKLVGTLDLLDPFPYNPDWNPSLGSEDAF